MPPYAPDCLVHLRVLAFRVTAQQIPGYGPENPSDQQRADPAVGRCLLDAMLEAAGVIAERQILDVEQHRSSAAPNSPVAIPVRITRSQNFGVRAASPSLVMLGCSIAPRPDGSRRLSSGWGLRSRSLPITCRCARVRRPRKIGSGRPDRVSCAWSTVFTGPSPGLFTAAPPGPSPGSGTQCHLRSGNAVGFPVALQRVHDGPGQRLEGRQGPDRPWAGRQRPWVSGWGGGCVTGAGHGRLV